MDRPSCAQTPVVLVFAGNDPTGGAGLQADSEALISVGCHPAPVVTALTVQDTRNVQRLVPVDAELVYAQAMAVLADLPVAAIKVGLTGSPAVVEAIAAVLEAAPAVPVIVDPILAAGGGFRFDDNDLRTAMCQRLLPLTTVLTPNTPEARLLAPEADTLDACAMALLDHDCEFVLLTGTHESSERVTNRLYGNHRLLETFTWDRLPHSYHGSGCTLASAVAGLLAQGHEPLSAIHEAQSYTWLALRAGRAAGRGQHLPNRLFWADQDP